MSNSSTWLHCDPGRAALGPQDKDAAVKADIVVKFLVPTLGPNNITTPFNF